MSDVKISTTAKVFQIVDAVVASKERQYNLMSASPELPSTAAAYAWIEEHGRRGPEYVIMEVYRKQ